MQAVGAIRKDIGSGVGLVSCALEFRGGMAGCDRKAHQWEGGGGDVEGLGGGVLGGVRHGGKSYKGRKLARRAGATGQLVQGTRKEHFRTIKQTYLVLVLLAVGVR